MATVQRRSSKIRRVVLFLGGAENKKMPYFKIFANYFNLLRV